MRVSKASAKNRSRPWQTLANDGPEKGSGLDVVRYDEAKLSANQGGAASWVKRATTHVTPWKTAACASTRL